MFHTNKDQPNLKSLSLMLKDTAFPLERMLSDSIEFSGNLVSGMHNTSFNKSCDKPTDSLVMLT